MAKKGRRSDQPSATQTDTWAASLPQRLVDGMIAVDQLTRQGKHDDAIALAEELCHVYPKRVEAWRILLLAASEAEDAVTSLKAVVQLAPMLPRDGDIQGALAQCYLANQCPFLAYEAYQRFIDRFADHDLIQEAQRTVATLSGILPELLQALQLTHQPNNKALARQFEQSLVWIQFEQYPQAHQALEQLLSKHATYLPALNTLCLVHFLRDDLQNAIATAQRVLTLAPDDIHALCHLVHYQLINGDSSAAIQSAARLKTVAQTAKELEAQFKTAEALSYLGDDDGVLVAFQAAEIDTVIAGEQGAFLCHFAATAAMRLSDEKRAKAFWQRALKLDKQLVEASDNLQDLKRPVHERNGPWAHSLVSWIGPTSTEAWFEEVVKIADPDDRDRQDDALDQACQQLLRNHPRIHAVLPLLLDRGDGDARTMTVTLAEHSDLPELDAHLRDFALSQKGSDSIRRRALAVCQRSVPEVTQVQFWLNGTWTTIPVYSFELHDQETDVHHSPDVLRLVRAGHEALLQGDTRAAIEKLRQALELAPTAIDIKHNLALAYQRAGQTADAERVIEDMFATQPDYLYSRVIKAGYLMGQGRLDAAQGLLTPLLKRRRLSYDDHFALISSWALLLAKKGDADGARYWQGVIEDMHPSHPMLSQFRKTLDRILHPTTVGGLLNRLWYKKQ